MHRVAVDVCNARRSARPGDSIQSGRTDSPLMYNTPCEPRSGGAPVQVPADRVLVSALLFGSLLWASAAKSQSIDPLWFASMSASALAGDTQSSSRLGMRLESALRDANERRRPPRLRSAAGASVYRSHVDAVVLIYGTDDSIGSGVLVRDRRTIVTNWHVVADGTQVLVFFHKVGSQPINTEDAKLASVIGFDKRADLALLELQAPASVGTPVAVSRRANVSVGIDVYAIGHPSGLLWTFTQGIVSQIRPDFEWSYEDGSKHSATVIQTQTAINPGNSGGPLFAASGELIGLNTFRAEGEGLNFAVALAEIRRVLSNRAELERSRPSPQPLPSKGEPEVLSSRDSNRDGVDDLFELDVDGDGQVDLWAYDSDADGSIDALGFDVNENGVVDTYAIDTDKDGKVELYAFDSDEDGEVDVYGVDVDGDGEIDRYEAAN